MIQKLYSSWEPIYQPNPTKSILKTIYDYGLYKIYAGCFVAGNVMVDENHLEGGGNVIVSAAVDNEERRDALRKMIKAAGADGATVIVQLNHTGPQTFDFINPHPFGPSEIQLKEKIGYLTFGKPVALTTEQVQTEVSTIRRIFGLLFFSVAQILVVLLHMHNNFLQVIDKHAYAAKVCADLEADGVEVNATHGFLLSQFLSKESNNRTDQYGGTLENRVRILVDIHSAIRKVVPKDFIVGFKLNSLEFQVDKLPVSDSVKICKTLEDCGCDFVQLTGGDMEQAGLNFTRETTRQREEYFTEFIHEVSQSLSKCVIYATGGFRSTKGMVEAVKNGLTQGIGIGRPTTQEPDLAQKILSGAVERARKTLIDQLDFPTTKKASNTQIAQMGVQPYSGDACEGIMDLSDKDTVDKYLKNLKRFESEMNDRVKRGLPVSFIFKFYTSVVE